MHRMFADAGRARARSSFLSVFACATVVLAAVLVTLGAERPPSTVEIIHASTTVPTAGWYEHDAPDPRRVRSDAVAIDAPTIPLGKREDGALQVPEDAHTAGWWTGRANPGERGPAVIVGHVDSREGPGAFWELPDLEVGDRVSVDREDGTSVHWRVERVEQHPKDAFPTEAVYGATDAPTLRLVTCSGFFDPEARSYTDNTIVFLRLDAEQDHVPERTEDVHDAAVRQLEPIGPPTAPSALGGPVARATAGVAADGRRVPILVAAMSLLLASAAIGRAWGGTRGAVVTAHRREPVGVRR